MQTGAGAAGAGKRESFEKDSADKRGSLVRLKEERRKKFDQKDFSDKADTAISQCEYLVANQCAKKVLELDFVNIKALYCQSLALFYSGDYQQVVDAHTKEFASFRNKESHAKITAFYLYSLCYRGLALIYLGRKEEADQDFQFVVDHCHILGKDYPILQYLLSLNKTNLGDWGLKAREYFANRAKNRDPLTEAEIELWLTRAIHLSKSGRFEKAIASFDMILSSEQVSKQTKARVYFHQGMAHKVCKQDVASGLSDLQTALIFHDNTYIRGWISLFRSEMVSAVEVLPSESKGICAPGSRPPSPQSLPLIASMGFFGKALQLPGLVDEGGSSAQRSPSLQRPILSPALTSRGSSTSSGSATVDGNRTPSGSDSQFSLSARSRGSSVELKGEQVSAKDSDAAVEVAITVDLTDQSQAGPEAAKKVEKKPPGCRCIIL